MRLLVVSATDPEIAPLIARFPGVAHGTLLRVRTCAFRTHQIDLLTTGVGMTATAAWCSHVLATSSYDLALNFGVCGSFDPALRPPAVVHVTADRIPELGAENNRQFLSIHELGLLGEDDFPFEGGRLVNRTPPVNRALRRLPQVHGITVNTVHGREESIAATVARFGPQVESMEGAAFMYACLIHGVPFAQVRAVSNVVEKRNREAWKMADAVQSLCGAALEILHEV